MCISRALREVHELITKLFVMNKHINIMTRLMTSDEVSKNTVKKLCQL